MNSLDLSHLQTQRGIPLPITLHICAESHAETFRKHCLVWWEDLDLDSNRKTYWKPGWRRPICFDAERDTIYKTGYKHSLDFKVLVQPSLKEHSTKIKKLKICDMYINAEIFRVAIGRMKNNPSWMAFFRCPGSRRSLSWFDSLRSWLISSFKIAC